MNLDKVSYYNLGAFEPLPGHGENGLIRIPKHIRKHLNEPARTFGLESVGIEIRFVTDAPTIDLYISVVRPGELKKGSVRVYKGNYLTETFELEQGIVKAYRITDGQKEKIVNESMYDKGGFAPYVWRIVCDRGIYALHGIDVHEHEMRPPRKEELPALDWLAYGSSITNSNLNGHIHMAASRLHLQVQNKGIAGGCRLEKEMVDYMLDECQWDFLTCELGVNMRLYHTAEEFKERASYLIDRLIQVKKPALLMSLFPNGYTMEYKAELDEYARRQAAYRQILEELVKQADKPWIEFVRGEDILTDVYGLKEDFIHPVVYGQALMGMNLAEKLRVFLEKQGLICNFSRNNTN